jgi:hypothetical protein
LIGGSQDVDKIIKHTLVLFISAFAYSIQASSYKNHQTKASLP